MRLCPQCGRTFDADVLVCEYDQCLLVANDSSRCRVPHCGDLLGAYRLVELMEVGGMGEIYRATDVRSGREVVVKVLMAELAHDTEMVARFFREAQITRSIEHPNVVRIFEVVDGESSPYPPYMVMELLEGQDLRHRLRAAGMLDPVETTEIALQVAETLTAVHESGVLHRDVKPDNIFLGCRGGSASPVTVKLLDFGVALALNPGQRRLTRHGSCVGTPEYIPPEQVLGRDMDERSDVYALGLLMYEMLTGRPPFRERHPQKTLVAQVNKQPASIARCRGGAVPAELDAVVMRCLRKDPAERFSSMQQLREALQASVVGPAEPVEVKRTWQQLTEQYYEQAKTGELPLG